MNRLVKLLTISVFPKSQSPITRFLNYFDHLDWYRWICVINVGSKVEKPNLPTSFEELSGLRTENRIRVMGLYVVHVFKKGSDTYYLFVKDSFGNIYEIKQTFAPRNWFG